jgi:hypothetical protein
MSGTATENPLVQDYLAELELAMRGLPEGQVRELLEQITAHLDDAIAPGAGEQEVAAILLRLGSPADLAAEARSAARPGVPPVSPTAPAATSAPATFRLALARIRRGTWAIAVVLVIAAIAGGRLADHYLSVPSLTYSNGGDWWFKQDARAEHIDTTATSTQNTTLWRPGQRQGYVISIFNGTNVTQTILGDASGPTRGWDNPGGQRFQMGVSTSYKDIANGFAGQQVAGRFTFTLPVSIPPFQSRLVRIIWTSSRHLCLSKGESGGINVLYLRVRVGWFTRTEVIPQQGWYLVGTASKNPCAHG